MAVFEDFNVETSKTYSLVNSASAFGSGKSVKLPSDGQYFAIAFNRSTREFEPVYFTDYNEAAATTAGNIQAGQRNQGTFKGSDIFIVRHANNELGLRPNLLAELTAWKEKFTTGLNPLVKKRDISFGQISRGMETVFPAYVEELKAAEVARKAVAAEKKAAAEATPPPPETPPAVASDPPVQPPVLPRERPASIIPAASEVLGRLPQQQRPEDDWDDGVSDGDYADGDYADEVHQSAPRRITGRIQMPLREGGFTFIDHGTSANNGRSIFVHETRLRGYTFGNGDAIEFELIDGKNPGTVQAANVSRPGEYQAAATQRAERQRDPRSLPPIVENRMTSDEGEPYDPDTAQPLVDGGSPFEGEPRRDRSGRVLIPDAWDNQPFRREEVAGGAPRPRSDGPPRRRGPGNDEPRQS